jgi:hypothetical protein
MLQLEQRVVTMIRVLCISVRGGANFCQTCKHADFVNTCSRHCSGLRIVCGWKCLFSKMSLCRLHACGPPADSRSPPSVWAEVRIVCMQPATHSHHHQRAAMMMRGEGEGGVGGNFALRGLMSHTHSLQRQQHTHHQTKTVAQHVTKMCKVSKRIPGLDSLSFSGMLASVCKAKCR